MTNKMNMEGNALKRKQTKKSKIVSITAAVLIVPTIAVAAASSFFYFFALIPGGMMRFVNGSKVMKADDPAITEAMYFADKTENAWLARNSQDKYITSKDKLKLHAYYVPCKKASDNYVILCHGYSCDATAMATNGKHYYDNNFNILLPDARGHGKSEGDYIGMGWHERLDILKWIEMIVEENPDAKIILHGVSMGAATVMMTAGEKLPENVKAAIEDCGYSSVWDEFAVQLKAVFHFPAFPLLNATSVVSQIRAGYGFKEASAVEQLKKCEIPMLFIHGSEDDFVPFSMLDVVYEASNSEKEKLVIDGAGHAMSKNVNPELYWGTVDKFISKHM